MIRSFAVAAMVCLAWTPLSQAQDGRGATAFGQLKSLAGDWEGTYEWTGTGAGGSMTAAYSLSGNGSAVVETLTMGGVPRSGIQGWSFEKRIAAAERAGLIRNGCARLPRVARKHRDRTDADGELLADAQVSEREARLAGQVIHVVMRDLGPGR